MSRNIIIKLGLLCGLFLMNSAFAMSSSPKASACPADASWFPPTSSMPSEVKKSNPDGTSNFCDFYQFSYQAFLYLMSPSSGDSSIRNFQVLANYPTFETNADGSPANSCDDSVTGQRFRVSLRKTQGIPERINQAGDGATIYDQNGNVVYYDVQFSKSMCDIQNIDDMNNFPSGSTEIKTAWRVLKDSDTGYITMTTDIGSQKNLRLGLVGFHLAVATTDHPEFVWATFERNDNSPLCAQPSTDSGWLFSSNSCAQALSNKDPLAIVQCQFNVATKQSATAITGSPTEICREYAYGTDMTDPNAVENVNDITSINQSVMQQLSGAMDVLKNYFIVGALWVSDTTQSSTISNQRGSLRLANTVAETTFQDVDISSSGFISNCFGCHNYSGTGEALNKNTTSSSLSHIFNDIAAGAGQCLDVQAGPIFSNDEAKTKCPTACKNTFSATNTWNGQWITTVPNQMSVCGCCAQ